VFIVTTELVQGPDKIIPSFVRLERSHQVRNFLRDEFPCYTVKGFFKSGEVVSDRERGKAAESESLIQGSDRVDCLVEGSPQIIDNVDSVAAEGSRHGLSHLEFVEIVSAVSVKLSNDSAIVWLTEKSQVFPFKLGNVILCPAYTEL
jgi:hypothetical protein